VANLCDSQSFVWIDSARPGVPGTLADCRSPILEACSQITSLPIRILAGIRSGLVECAGRFLRFPAVSGGDSQRSRKSRKTILSLVTKEVANATESDG
jgi:hypothetical protein